MPAHYRRDVLGYWRRVTARHIGDTPELGDRSTIGVVFSDARGARPYVTYRTPRLSTPVRFRGDVRRKARATSGRAARRPDLSPAFPVRTLQARSGVADPDVCVSAGRSVRTAV